MNKTQRGWVWLGLALAAACWGWKNRRLVTAGDVTTGESAAYPALRSRVYYAETGRAMAAAEQALSRLPGWALASKDAENEIIEASAKSAFSLAADDVTIYFFALGHGQVRVTVRARTRSGAGDFGRNAAHIRQLQAAMDDRLNAGAAF